MSNPIDLLSKDLNTAPELARHEIADGKALSGLRARLVALLHPLRLITLTGRERQALPPVSTAEQRRLSSAHVRLLRQRPDIERSAGVCAADFERVLDKDEGLDMLAQSLSRLLSLVGDGQLLLSAALSQGTLRVIDFVRRTVHDESVPREQRDRIGISFGSVDLSLMRLRTLQRKREQRRARVHEAQRERLDATMEETGFLPKIARLRRDALTDRGLATPIPRRNRRGRKGPESGGRP